VGRARLSLDPEQRQQQNFWNKHNEIQ